MARIYITEEQFKTICNIIKEDEYAQNYTVGTFGSEQEARSFLSYIREKYGFSEYDSYVNGTSVIVSVEKSTTDDSYFYELIDSMKQEAENLSKYRMVAESTK